MLRRFSRRVLLLALLAPVMALGQTASSLCDLTLVETPKRHLSFADPDHADVSALLSSGYADLAHGSQLFDQARQLAVTAEDKCGEALAEYGVAAALDRTRTDEIRDHLQRSVELFSEIGATHALAQAHYVLARVLQRSNRSAEAAALAQTSAEEFAASGDRERAIGTKVSAILMQQANPSASGIQALLDEARAVNAKAAQGSILHLWGDTEFSAGHYATALQRYEEARKVFEDCACDPSAFATLLVSMGRLERIQGQPKQALKDYARALQLQQSVGEREYSIQTMNAMAVAYDAMGERQESLRQYERALAEAKSAGAKEFVPFLEGNIGGEYLKLKQYGAAAARLQKVIASGISKYQLCFRENQLAEAMFHLSRLTEAHDAADKAVEVCRKGADRESTTDALETRGEVAMAQKKYATALDDVHEAMAMREEIRSHLVPDDARKQGYNERIQDLYDTSVELLTRLRRDREALETAENGRARAFLDLMGTQAMPPNSGNAALQIDAPSYASYVSAAPDTAMQMVDTARHYHSTIIAYWASEKTLYAWVVGPAGGVFEARIPVTRKRLAQLITETVGKQQIQEDTPRHEKAMQTAGLSDRGSDAIVGDESASPAWRTLYDLLIAPIASHLPRTRGSLLTIVPHHELFRLSFAALKDPAGGYLIERYAIHTVPATGLLRYTQQNEGKASALPTQFLLVANPRGATLPNGVSLPPLPETRNEVRSIAKLLPTSEVTTFTDSQATESGVTAALESATVVHFATHAVLNDADPRQSFLSFYPEQTSDARLTTSDVYRLKLHTHLVVLSACRTGLGRISGDGIEGFSRAFFYAGTASFLATLWNVADEPTAMLLPKFYREWTGGKTRSTALRAAEIDLIRQLRAGKIRAKTPLGPMTLPENPIFWASFSLSGEP